MSEAEKNPEVMAQPLCERHQAYLVNHVLPTREDEPWRAVIIVANLLFFQAITADKGFHARCGGDAESMSLILAELGPSCCAVRDSVQDRIWKVMAKGISHAAQVSQRKVIDPNFDIATLENTLRRAAR
jgi:hypothetical protein